MGAVYRAVCKSNGKIYVGQTTKSGWKERYGAYPWQLDWMQRKGKKLRPFDLAVAKHGWLAFEFRDLMTNVEDADLDGLERFFIRHYRSNEKAHGYNCESGGNRNKHVSEETRQRSSDARQKPARWKHREHGEFVGGARALAKLHPELNLGSLGRVKSGLLRQHSGWVCLDAPHRVCQKRAAHLWEHPEHGQVVASTGGLSRKFPEQKLSKQELAYVANPCYIWSKSHKGWEHVRPATQEEERECCLAGDV